MNQKTAKLINSYASSTGEKRRALKRRWTSLSAPEREKLRRQMKRDLAEE